MLKRTMSVLGCLLLISACAKTVEPTKLPPVAPVTRVEVKTVEVKKPAPIVPPVDQLKLRNVQWIVLTPENVDEKFAALGGSDVVLFALTAKGYENLGLNLSDVRANIDQYKAIIAVYERSFK